MITVFSNKLLTIERKLNVEYVLIISLSNGLLLFQ